MLRLDARTVIMNFEQCIRTAYRDSDPDLSPARRKLHGIVDEIDNCLAKDRPISIHENSAVAFDGHRLLLLLGHHLQ
jgi:hypothetical protein